MVEPASVLPSKKSVKLLCKTDRERIVAKAKKISSWLLEIHNGSRSGNRDADNSDVLST